MTKVIFIICDGISDRPISELGFKTPLEAARTPNLDKLATNGICGVMNTVEVGIRPGSDTAHLSLFGYDPKIYYSGRGPFEVAGLDMDFRKGDIAFRANMGTVDKNLTVVDRRAGRVDNTEEYAKLFNQTKIDGVTFLLKRGTGHRLGFIVRGNSLSDKITDADPHKTGVRVKRIEPLDSSKEAKHTANILNRFLELSHQQLETLKSNKERIKRELLPANFILLRGAGKVVSLPSFFEKYGLRAACIAGAGLYRGIGKILGMKVLPVEGATGKPDSNIANKINRAIKELHNYDFVFIHIKGADTLAEDGNWQGKKQFIEKIDAALRPILHLDNTLIVVTADHTTSSLLKTHTADNVPLVISGEQVRVDHIKKFGERECAKGSLGHIKGLNLMPIIVDLLGLSDLYGA